MALPGLTFGAGLDGSAWSQLLLFTQLSEIPISVLFSPTLSTNKGPLSSTFSLKPCLFRLSSHLTL